MGYGLDVENIGGSWAEQDFLDEYIGEIYEDREKIKRYICSYLCGGICQKKYILK